MNLNQEFHEHLQAGRLTEAISLVVGQLVELKITTKASSGRLHTTVDLLNGQITNTVDPAFFSDKSSQKLLEFHTNQIAATSQVVREQLRSLQDLLQALHPPEAPRDNIKLIAIAESVSSAIAGGESDPMLSLAKESITPVNSSINSLAAAPAAIISAQTSETLPVALVEPVIPTPSITEKSADQPEPQVAKTLEHSPISQPEPQVAKAPEHPISQPEPQSAKTPEHPPISQPEPQVAKAPEHPISQPEPQSTKTVEYSAVSQPQVAQAPDDLQIYELEEDSDITAADLEPLAAKTAKPPEELAPAANRSPLAQATPAEQGQSKLSEHVKLPETPPLPKPESRAGIASGLAAALAQTSALDPAEAAAIPNKFDQALRLAGVRSTTEEDPHPFATSKSVIEPIINQPVIEQPTELIPRRELIDLLRESEDDWDEWLLEEDNILSELSDVTKDKLPDLESHWLSEGLPGATSSSVSIKSSPADWEEFMPEYPEVSAVASKNHANVERFRQNLVNDPQLMSELLAELDDLEEMEEGQPKL